MQKDIASEDTPMRCAIYARYSSEMQSPSSVEDQERECRQFAATAGWEVVGVEYDRAQRAGSTAGRHGYHALLQAAERREMDIVLVEEMSRFSRDFVDGLGELAQLKRHGVRLADTKNGLVDLDSMVGQLRLAIDLASSQQETKRLGERSKRGLRGQVQKGFSSGGRPPYGLRREAVFSADEVDVDGRPKRVGVKFVPDDVEAPIVRRIFEEYSAGESKTGIARRLTREGILTRDAGKAYKGRKVSGTWAAAQIKGILGNAVYTGTRIWNRYSRTGEKLPVSGKKAMRPNDQAAWVTVEDWAEPIVDTETWERVQKRLAEDAAKYAQNHVAGEKRRHLLSGLLRCGSCGRNYVIQETRRGVSYYRCTFRQNRGRDGCTNATGIPRPPLEHRVKHLLDTVAKSPAQLADLVAEHNRRIDSANEHQLAVVRKMEADLGELEAQAQRLVDAVAQGSGKLERLVSELERREATIEGLKKQVETARAQVHPRLVPRVGALEDFVSGGASVFTGDFTQDRALLETAIDGVFVHEDGSIIIRFRSAGLFEPLSTVALPSGLSMSEAEELAEGRARHADGPRLVDDLAQFGVAPGDGVLDAAEDGTGNTQYRFTCLPGAVDRLPWEEAAGEPLEFPDDFPGLEITGQKETRSGEGPGLLNSVSVPTGI